jgi:hypothetical protein
MNKKNGAQRLIRAPQPPLKNIQRKLNEVLQKIYWENYEKRRKYIFGFACGQHIFDNAQCHIRSKYVINIDLKNFFDEITFPRVRGMFMKYPFMLPKEAATVLAHIVTHEFRLPQGAPTSPVISNFILARMDGELWKFARKHHCQYSRYADDITFSTKQAKLPPQVGTLTENGFKLSSTLENIIAIQNVFPINFNKVRCMRQYNRQEVTGLTVNDKVNVDSRYVKQIRAMLHDWELHGEKEALHTHLMKWRKKHINPKRTIASYRNIVFGKLQFLKQIKGENSLIFRRLLFQFNMLLKAPEAIIASLTASVLSLGIYIIMDETEFYQGTAFKIAGIGIITNAHVLPDNSQPGPLIGMIAFQHHDASTRFKMHLLFIDTQKDFAILKFMGESPSPCFISASTSVQLQQKVYIAGYPNYSNETVTCTEAKIINQLTRFDTIWYSVDKPILTGNSGGPVLNENLEVVGIASRGGETMEEAGESINAFIPIAYVLDAAKENIKSCIQQGIS